MYIVITTFSVDPRLHDKWLALMSDHFIPYLKQKCEGDVTFSKLLNNDTQSHTYSLQLKASSVSFFNEYTSVHFNEYLAIATELFGDAVLHFNSVLKVIE